MTDAERDALLVVRAQLGDRRALGELVGHWHLPVWRYVRAIGEPAGPGLLMIAVAVVVLVRARACRDRLRSQIAALEGHGGQ